MSEIRNGVKEKIVKIIDNSIMAVLVDGRFNPSPYADEILAIPELAIVDREAKMPNCPSFITTYWRAGYLQAHEDMNGWVKEVKDAGGNE